MSSNTIDRPQNRVIHWMTRLLGGTAVLFLFAMMLLTFIDVWGRAFLYPVMGGFEITEIMLATLILG